MILGGVRDDLSPGNLVEEDWKVWITSSEESFKVSNGQFVSSSHPLKSLPLSVGLSPPLCHSIPLPVNFGYIWLPTFLFVWEMMFIPSIIKKYPDQNHIIKVNVQTLNFIVCVCNKSAGHVCGHLKERKHTLKLCHGYREKRQRRLEWSW